MSKEIGAIPRARLRLAEIADAVEGFGFPLTAADIRGVIDSMSRKITKKTTERVSAKMTPELRRQIIQRVQTSVDTPYAAIAKEFNVAGGRVTEIMRSIGA